MKIFMPYIKNFLRKILSHEEYNKLQWTYNKLRRKKHLNYYSKDKFLKDFNKNNNYCAFVKKSEDVFISIVIVTYNNLKLTKKTLESILLFSNYNDYELIVVDNNSTDGTQKFLKNFSTDKSYVRLIYNNSNVGFAAANNIGIKTARGDYIILMNNDVYVTPNWIRNLLVHFNSDDKIGMVGPRTNNIGNAARIEAKYDNIEEMIKFSQKIYLSCKGMSYQMKVLAFFCVMIKKEVFDAIGLLDEVYGIGLFEDDDFCNRARMAGFSLICADDVFIHHHLSASIDDMGYKRKRNLFERNKAIYEAKYGKWMPHQYRQLN